MNAFESIQDKVLANFSEWIQINDPKSNWTIEDFPYETGINEDITKPHCWKCATVNQCWFKNENGKKPITFDYSKYSFSEVPKSKRGLYHPNCHCQGKSINVPKINDIKLIFLQGKVDNFFKKKLKWFYKWGYENEDQKEFISLIKQLSIEGYRYGNYEKEKHTQFGYQINIFIHIPGKNEKKNKIFKCWTSYMIFPNGKLKLNTIIGGEEK